LWAAVGINGLLLVGLKKNLMVNLMGCCYRWAEKKNLIEVLIKSRLINGFLRF
jgi:hypothetical protein